MQVATSRRNTLRRIFFSSRWANEAIVTCPVSLDISFSERFAFSAMTASVVGGTVSIMVAVYRRSDLVLLAREQVSPDEGRMGG